MKETSRGHDLEVIAGHCSVNPEKVDQIYEMAEIQVADGRGGTQRALSAVRFVGLKSRTELNPTGEGMGMDFGVIEQAILCDSKEVPPTVLLAEKFVRETGVGIAEEVMIPHIQMPYYEGRIPKGQFFPWNPSINQLGWQILEMATIAQRNNWTVGLKNGKWLGEPYEKVADSENALVTSMEKAWLGLASYAPGCHVAFIHRGVDVPEKGDHRNALVHEVVKRLAKKKPDAGRYFDPSHSFGPKLRDHIVDGTIEAMKMKIGNDFLYTGILIEAGDSKTDTQQHITIDELRYLVNELSKFRKLRGPFQPTK